MKFLNYLILISFFTSVAFATSYAPQGYDAVRSPDRSKTWTFPSVTGTLSCIACTETLTNKSMSGSSNTFTNIPNSATTATSANTVSAIVARDGSGNFSAGTITAALTGTASQATNSTNVGITDDTTTNATMYPLWVTTTTGNLPAKISSTKMSFNPSTGRLTTTAITSALTGNADTATALAANPAACGADTYVIDTAANGNLTCGTVTNAGLAGSIAASKLVGSDIATVGTVTSGTWSAGTIALNKGGTGQTTKAAAFDALSPMTTIGDIVVGSTSGTGIRLANGTAGYVLTAQSGAPPAWAASTGGGEGTNYLSGNSKAEIDTSGWTTYDDAAAAPVDGTGGTVTTTWTRTTSTPLAGAASFLLTKDAANRQGEGVCYDATISDEDKYAPLQMRGSYEIASGTYATGDLTIYAIGDPAGTPAVRQPSNYQIQNRGIESQFPPVVFQNEGWSTIRVCIHIASTSASAYTVKFDSLQLGPNIGFVGPPISEWANFTPTLTNAPLTSSSGRWRRVGDSMEIQYRFTLSGVATGTVSIPMISGYTIDTSKIPDSDTGSDTENGRGVFFDASTGDDYDMRVYPTSSTVFGLRILSASGTYSAGGASVTATTPVAPASSDVISANVRVPIVGWGSNVSIGSDNSEGRVVAGTAYRTSSAQTGINTNATAVKIALNSSTLTSGRGGDTHGAWDTVTNNRYNVLVPGKYTITGSVQIAATNVLNAAYYAVIYRNGAAAAYGGSIIPPAANIFNATVTAQVDAVAGDYFELFLYGAGNNSASTLTANVGSSVTFMDVARIAGPVLPTITDTYSARYKTAAGQSVPNTTTPIIDFGTKDWDSHTMCTTGASFKCTAPISGKWEICNLGTYAASTYAGTSSFYNTIFKNGSDAGAALWYYRSEGGSASLAPAGSGCTDLNLLANDYIDIRAFQDNGATENLESLAAHNWMTFKRVGN